MSRAAIAGDPAEDTTPDVATGATIEGVLALLDRAAILTAEDIEHRIVPVPEWGGAVRVRGMTGSERDSYDAESYRMGQAGAAAITDFRVRRVARCLVDADGKRLFTDADVVALGKKNGAVIDRLDDVVAELSGLGEAATKKASADLKVAPSVEAGSA